MAQLTGPNDGKLLASLTDFQNLLRNEQAALAKENEKRRTKQTDVTGRWLGFDESGYGLVEFDGRIFVCLVMSSTCKQKYAKVNLRRTRTANYVDWQ